MSGFYSGKGNSGQIKFCFWYFYIVNFYSFTSRSAHSCPILYETSNGLSVKLSEIEKTITVARIRIVAVLVATEKMRCRNKYGLSWLLWAQQMRLACSQQQNWCISKKAVEKFYNVYNVLLVVSTGILTIKCRETLYRQNIILGPNYFVLFHTELRFPVRFFLRTTMERVSRSAKSTSKIAVHRGSVRYIPVYWAFLI